MNAEQAREWGERGKELKQAHRYEEALAAYEQALELDAHLPQANLGLGTLLRRRGRIDEARKFCKIASQSSDESIRDAALHCLQ